MATPTSPGYAALISGHHQLSGIALERAAHAGSFLLVEGPSDSRLFKQLVDQAACSITVCHGRENALAVVHILEEDGFCGFIAVVDADYAAFTGENVESENVCVTDHNDIECMIIASKAWDRVIIEYGSESKVAEVEKLNGKTTKDVVLEQAAFVGSLRLAARKNGWALHFDSMKYRFRSNTSIEIDQQKTVEHIIARSSLPFQLHGDDLLAEAQAELDSASDYFVLCSGHDICRVLARGLRNNFGSYNGFEGEDGLKNLARISHGV